MWELFALLVYSVQWLGIVLGVGAEAVLLVGHLLALHARRPQWLSTIPEVRVVQRWGLVLIVASGAAAVLYQLLNNPSVLFISTFGFKWVLIALCSLAFWAERWLNRGRGLLEGFAGATWFALFVVHSTAPIFLWEDLFFFYGVWMLGFLTLWGSIVWVMKRAQPRASALRAHREAPHEPAPLPVSKPLVQRSAPVSAPKPAVRAKPVPPQPAPVAPPKPAPVIAAAPVPQPLPETEAEVHIEERPSLWQRIRALFVRPHRDAPAPVPVMPVPEPVPAPAPVPAAPAPTMARVSAPISYTPDYKAPAAAPQPIAAPVAAPDLSRLELMPPHTVAPTPVVEAQYVPDYNSLPGVMVMPQKPDELSRQNRPPIVQPA